MTSSVFNKLSMFCVCPLRVLIDMVQDKAVGDDNAKTAAEVAAIEDQLNAIEKYAMHFMEEENAEFAKAQLRLAEVNSVGASRCGEITRVTSYCGMIYKYVMHNVEAARRYTVCPRGQPLGFY